MTTFAELDKEENPNYHVLKSILEYNARIGLPIYSPLVIGIIKRIQLKPEQKKELTDLAKIGVKRQIEIRFPNEARQYQQVVNFLV